jgi:hypothetical protein
LACGVIDPTGPRDGAGFQKPGAKRQRSQPPRMGRLRKARRRRLSITPFLGMYPQPTNGRNACRPAPLNCPAWTTVLTSSTRQPCEPRCHGWDTRCVARATPRVPRCRAGPTQGRRAPPALLARRRGRLPPLPVYGPTRPTASTAGRPFRPSAPAWTNSNAGERVTASPDRYRTGRTLDRHWRA